MFSEGNVTCIFTVILWGNLFFISHYNIIFTFLYSLNSFLAVVDTNYESSSVMCDPIILFISWLLQG